MTLVVVSIPEGREDEDGERERNGGDRVTGLV